MFSLKYELLISKDDVFTGVIIAVLFMFFMTAFAANLSLVTGNIERVGSVIVAIIFDMILVCIIIALIVNRVEERKTEYIK